MPRATRECISSFIASIHFLASREFCSYEIGRGFNDDSDFSGLNVAKEGKRFKRIRRERLSRSRRREFDLC